jgi:hypothetical protein
MLTSARACKGGLGAVCALIFPFEERWRKRLLESTIQIQFFLPLIFSRGRNTDGAWPATHPTTNSARRAAGGRETLDLGIRYVTHMHVPEDGWTVSGVAVVMLRSCS